MPKIAILGSNGFLGTPIFDAFKKEGWEVIPFSRTIKRNLPAIDQAVNIFDESSLQIALAWSKPDVVLSTAWVTEHGKFWSSTSNPAYRDATLRFAELSFKSGVETFIGLGTMSEYGLSPGLCNSEITPVVATDIYSKSKIETGLQLLDIGEKYGKRTNWARIFQAFGPNEKVQRFVPSLIESLKRDESFNIRTPDYKMDWIHTADIASAIIFTIENDLNHFVDIGTGVGTTVKELSELICLELGFNNSLLSFENQISGDERMIVVDPSTQILSSGWKPEASLRERLLYLS